MAKSSKGSAFERQLCTELSLWWTHGENDAVFWRTSGSGARATTRARKDKPTVGQYGDITAIDPIGKLFTDLITTEVKRGYNKFSFADLLDKPALGEIQKYEEWFGQVWDAQQQAGTPYWLLVVKRDKREPLVILSEELFRALAVYVSLIQLIRPSAILSFPWGMIHVITLQDFFKVVKPEQIQELVKNYD